MDIMKEAQALYGQIIADRRHLHQCPELGLELPQTKAYVMQRLRELGYQPQEIGKCGVTALVGGKKPGKVFLLRADMDGLPIREETGLEFASQNGNMHACGHDTHPAMLLGAAKILKDHENELEGTVKLLFQPGEETMEGAKDVVDAGILENPHVDAAMMLHIQTGLPLPSGTVAVLGEGACFASVDWFRIDVQGKGSHGAMPESSVSPVNIVCAINTAIQEVIAMSVPSAQQAVMTVGEIHSGSTGNIIPDTGFMRGTIRTYDAGIRIMLKERLVKLAEEIAASRGGKATVTFSQSAPPTLNNRQMRELALRCLREELGSERVTDLMDAAGGAYKRVSGSEDFAYIAEQVPSLICFVLAGNPENGYSYQVHHPKTSFREEDMPLGTATYVKMAMEWLALNK